jgi:hypothetical protein
MGGYQLEGDVPMMSPGPGNDFLIQRLRQLRKEKERDVRPRSKRHVGPFGGETSYAILGVVGIGCAILLVVVEYLL